SPSERAATRANPFQRRRVASQTKPIQECHPFASLRAGSECSEGSLARQRSFAALRMTKRDGLFFRNGLATRAPTRDLFPGYIAAHTLTVWSSPAEAIYLLSGDHATAFT